MAENPGVPAIVPEVGTGADAARARIWAAWDEVPAMVAVIRASDLVYEYANRSYCEASYFESPPIGRPFGQDSDGRTDYDLRALVRRIAETGEPFARRDMFVHLGTRGDTWFDVSYQPVRGEAGEVTSVMLFAYDVTARLRAERDAEDRAELARRQRDALRASETRLERVMGTPLIGVVFWNGARAITECNQAFLRMTGYERADVAEGRLAWPRMTPPEWAAADAEATEALRARGACAPFEMELWRKDGSRVPVVVGAAMFPDAPSDGVSFVFDLTDAKRAERQLDETRTLLLAVLRNLPITVFAVGPDARVRVAAGRLLESRGWRSEQLVGKTARELFPLSPQAADNVERALHGESFTVADDFGVHGVFESSYAPLRAPDGATIGAVGMSIDVTPRVRAEEERSRLEEQMVRTQKLESLGLLAGGVAHDFNNLLTSIVGNVAIARLEADDDARAALDDALSSARSAAALTRQLLAYAGRTPFDVRRIDPSAHIGEIARLLEATLPKKVRLELDLATGLPAIEADVAQVQQVVMNLVINAAEASTEGSGVVTVRTRAADDGGVVLEVADRGSGMDPATLARVFDPFFTTKGPGRGLGLAAIQGIVRGHRASIAIDSIPGVGTTFTITFPAASGPAPRQAPSGAMKIEGRGAVLLVDDEPAVRRAARRALEHLGFDVVEAESGRAALEAYAARAADVVAIVLDVTMPDWSGEETLAQLRAKGVKAPVLFSSGYGELDPAARSDVAGFLPKPYTSDELEAALARALATRRPEADRGG